MDDLRSFPTPPPERHGLKRAVGVLIVLALLAAGGAFVRENRPQPTPPPAVANDRLPSY